jgi:hypothetical protein
MRRFALLAITLAAPALATGCEALGLKTVAHVESDTRWSGSFGGSTVDGAGNAEIDLGDNDSCIAVQKQTEQGFLTAWVNHGEHETTFAAYGVVSACK